MSSPQPTFAISASVARHAARDLVVSLAAWAITMGCSSPTAQPLIQGSRAVELVPTSAASAFTAGSQSEVDAIGVDHARPWPDALGSYPIRPPPPCSCTASLFWPGVLDQTSCSDAVCPRMPTMPRRSNAPGELSAWSPDGRHFAQAFEEGVVVFGLDTPEPLFFDESDCEKLGLGTGGLWLACARKNSLRFSWFNGDRRSFETTLNEPAWAQSLLVHGDGVLLRGHDKLVRWLSAATEATVDLTRLGPCFALASSGGSDGLLAAVTARRLILFGGAELKLQVSVELPAMLHGSDVRALSVTSTGHVDMLIEDAQTGGQRLASWVSGPPGRGSWRSRKSLHARHDAPRHGVWLRGGGGTIEWEELNGTWRWSSIDAQGARSVASWRLPASAKVETPTVAFSPDGAHMVVTTALLFGVLALDRGEPAWMVSRELGVPWGATLRVALDRRAWGFHAGRKACWMTRHGVAGCRAFEAEIETIAFTPDGDSFLVDTVREVFFVDGRTGELAAVSVAKDLVNWSAVGDSGVLAARESSTSRTVLWSPDVPETLRQVPGGDRCRLLASSLRGLDCLTDTGDLLFWQDPQALPQVRWSGLSGVQRLASTRDGNLLAVLDHAGKIRLWRVSAETSALLPAERVVSAELWDAGSPWWIERSVTGLRSRQGRWPDRTGDDPKQLAVLTSDVNDKASSGFTRVELRDGVAAFAFGGQIFALVPRFAAGESTTGEAHARLIAPDGTMAEFGVKELGEPWFCTRAARLVPRAECPSVDGRAWLKSQNAQGLFP